MKRIAIAVLLAGCSESSGTFVVIPDAGSRSDSAIAEADASQVSEGDGGVAWGDSGPDASQTDAGQPGSSDAGPPGRDSGPDVSGSTAISAYGFNTCAIRSGQVVCWGATPTILDPDSGFPTDRTFVEVSVGYEHACALRSDGVLRCWGRSPVSASSVPAGTYRSVSSGRSFACAIRTDNTVVCWGLNDMHQTEAPLGTFSAIVSGSANTCGIRMSDSTLRCWGASMAETPPDGSYDRILRAGGGNGFCALNGGHVDECWNTGTGSPDRLFPGYELRAIAIRNNSFACGTDVEDVIACWGTGGWTPPLFRFTQLTAGSGHFCGITVGRDIECWGDNDHHQLEVP